MEITDFIDYIKAQSTYMRRGDLINKIAFQQDDWCIVLRALLIKNLQESIFKSYLLEKLRFMKDNPKRAHFFLDIYGTRIYNAIKDYNQFD